MEDNYVKDGLVEETTNPTEEKAEPATQPAETTTVKSNDGKLKLTSILFRIDVVLLFVLEVLTIVAFCVGMTSVFDEHFSILQCVFSVIDLFYYNSAIAYRLITGIILAVVYVICFILMIKNLISSIRVLHGINKRAYQSTLSVLKDSSSDTFVASFFFVIAASLVSKTQFTVLSSAVLILTGIIYVFHEFAAYVVSNKKINVLQLIFNCAICALMFAVIGTLLTLFKQPVVKEFLEGCRVLFSGVLGTDIPRILHVLFSYIALPVMFGVMAILIIIRVSFQLSGYSTNRKTARRQITGIMIFAIVILILQLVFNGFFLNGIRELSSDVVELWWTNVKCVYMPLVLLTIGWRILSSFVPNND